MKAQLIHLISKAAARAYPDFNLPTIHVEHPKNPEHGDFSTNLALLIAKPLASPPRAVAEKILAELRKENLIQKAEIAGPGFINFFLQPEARFQVVAEILLKSTHFGHHDQGRGEKIHIEYVSANPTGPLHVGHGRGAAYGSALAHLLKTAGYEVHREYYINDAGRQMNILAVSVWLRYLELGGLTFPFPKNAYRGDYVKDIAALLRQKYAARFEHPREAIFSELPPDEDENGHGDKEAYIDALIVRAHALLGSDYTVVFQEGLQNILEDIRQDLAAFGVEYDEWFSEQSLMDNGAVQHAIEVLTEKGHVYTQDQALWFRATAFGDEKDRVLVRDDGRPTYFASDVAYHLSKMERGYSRIIDILGADHHGYVPRVRAAMRALGIDDTHFATPLVQFAVLYRGAERVQMSTRSGSFVTLRELREEVSSDATRFFYLMRKPDQHMDFDLDLAKSESNENPVYYSQYAYARICSVFRKCAEENIVFKGDLSGLPLLTDEHEQALFRLFSQYADMIAQAAQSLEPHLLVNYLRELSQAFHAYYNAVNFLKSEPRVQQARFAVLKASQQLYLNLFEILGIQALEKM